MDGEPYNSKILPLMGYQLTFKTSWIEYINGFSEHIGDHHNLFSEPWGLLAPANLYHCFRPLIRTWRWEATAVTTAPSTRAAAVVEVVAPPWTRRPANREHPVTTLQEPTVQVHQQTSLRKYAITAIYCMLHCYLKETSIILIYFTDSNRVRTHGGDLPVTSRSVGRHRINYATTTSLVLLPITNIFNITILKKVF